MVEGGGGWWRVVAGSSVVKSDSTSTSSAPYFILNVSINYLYFTEIMIHRLHLIQTRHCSSTRITSLTTPTPTSPLS